MVFKRLFGKKGRFLGRDAHISFLYDTKEDDGTDRFLLMSNDDGDEDGTENDDGGKTTLDMSQDEMILEQKAAISPIVAASSVPKRFLTPTMNPDRPFLDVSFSNIFGNNDNSTTDGCDGQLPFSSPVVKEEEFHNNFSSTTDHQNNEIQPQSMQSIYDDDDEEDDDEDDNNNDDDDDDDDDLEENEDTFDNDLNETSIKRTGSALRRPTMDLGGGIDDSVGHGRHALRRPTMELGGGGVDDDDVGMKRSSTPMGRSLRRPTMELGSVDDDDDDAEIPSEPTRGTLRRPTMDLGGLGENDKATGRSLRRPTLDHGGIGYGYDTAGPGNSSATEGFLFDALSSKGSMSADTMSTTSKKSEQNHFGDSKRSSVTMEDSLYKSMVNDAKDKKRNKKAKRLDQIVKEKSTQLVGECIAGDMSTCDLSCVQLKFTSVVETQEHTKKSMSASSPTKANAEDSTPPQTVGNDADEHGADERFAESGQNGDADSDILGSSYDTDILGSSYDTNILGSSNDSNMMCSINEDGAGDNSIRSELEGGESSPTMENTGACQQQIIDKSNADLESPSSQFDKDEEYTEPLMGGDEKKGSNLNSDDDESMISFGLSRRSTRMSEIMDRVDFHLNNSFSSDDKLKPSTKKVEKREKRRRSLEKNIAHHKSHKNKQNGENAETTKASGSKGEKSIDSLLNSTKAEDKGGRSNEDEGQHFEVRSLNEDMSCLSAESKELFGISDKIDVQKDNLMNSVSESRGRASIVLDNKPRKKTRSKEPELGGVKKRNSKISISAGMNGEARSATHDNHHEGRKKSSDKHHSSRHTRGRKAPRRTKSSDPILVVSDAKEVRRRASHDPSMLHESRARKKKSGDKEKGKGGRTSKSSSSSNPSGRSTTTTKSTTHKSSSHKKHHHHSSTNRSREGMMSKSKSAQDVFEVRPSPTTTTKSPTRGRLKKSKSSDDDLRIMKSSTMEKEDDMVLPAAISRNLLFPDTPDADMSDEGSKLGKKNDMEDDDDDDFGDDEDYSWFEQQWDSFNVQDADAFNNNNNASDGDIGTGEKGKQKKKTKPSSSKNMMGERKKPTRTRSMDCEIIMQMRGHK